MNLMVAVAIAVGVLTPAFVALVLLNSPLLSVTSGLGAFMIEMPCAMLWLESHRRQQALGRRLRLVAAPLTGEPRTDEASDVDVKVFRQQRDRLWLVDQIEAQFPLVDIRQALPKVLWLGAASIVVGGLAAVFFDLGWLSVPLALVCGLGVSGTVLALQDSSRRAEFIRIFPGTVDQTVRLMQTGLPPMEAIAVAAEEVPPPVNSVLQEIVGGVSAGLDPETVIRRTAARIRIPEFTLFSAAICLQRRTGGGVSDALGNLSATLRARHETTAKKRSATAQTRLTLLVLALVPVAVLCVQSFNNPAAVKMLFYTDSGVTLLRYGVGFILAGLLVARSLAARIGR